MKTIIVTNAKPQKKDGGFELAVFERHNAHKDGELYIGDDRVYKVSLTTEVKKALTDGRLKEFDDDSKEAGKAVDMTADKQTAPANTDESGSDTDNVAASSNSDAGDEDETDAPYVDETDTVETLTKRYNRGELEDLAVEVGVADPQDYANMKLLAEAVLESV